MMEKELNIYFDGNDWVIAESPADAVLAWEENGLNANYSETDGTAESWEQVQDDELTIVYEDDPNEILGVPDRASVEFDDGLWKVTASVKGWIEHQGRGFLCSLDW